MLNAKRITIFLCLLFIGIGVGFWAIGDSTEGIDSSWSSDGEWIVFACGFHNLSNPYSWIYLMRSDGTKLQKITTDEYMAELPSWSPDGEWIAFYSNSKIYKMRPDGTDITELIQVNHRDDVFSLDWSSGGDWIAYSTFNISGGTLYITSLDTYEATELLSGESAYDSIRWSVDDSQIAYVVLSSNASNGISIVDVESETTTEVYSTPSQLGQLDWFYADTELILTLRTGSESFANTLNTETNRFTELSIDNFSDAPTVSNDVNWIVYIGQSGNIYKANIEGSQVEQLSNVDGCFPSKPQWFSYDVTTDGMQQ